MNMAGTNILQRRVSRPLAFITTVNRPSGTSRKAPVQYCTSPRGSYIRVDATDLIAWTRYPWSRARPLSRTVMQSHYSSTSQRNSEDSSHIWSRQSMCLPPPPLPPIPLPLPLPLPLLPPPRLLVKVTYAGLAPQYD